MAYLDKNGLNYYSQKVSGKIQDVQDDLDELKIIHYEEQEIEPTIVTGKCIRSVTVYTLNNSAYATCEVEAGETYRISGSSYYINMSAVVIFSNTNIYYTDRRIEGSLIINSYGKSQQNAYLTPYENTITMPENAKLLLVQTGNINSYPISIVKIDVEKVNRLVYANYLQKEEAANTYAGKDDIGKFISYTKTIESEVGDPSITITDAIANSKPSKFIINSEINLGDSNFSQQVYDADMQVVIQGWDYTVYARTPTPSYNSDDSRIFGITFDLINQTSIINSFLVGMYGYKRKTITFNKDVTNYPNIARASIVLPVQIDFNKEAKCNLANYRNCDYTELEENEFCIASGQNENEVIIYLNTQLQTWNLYNYHFLFSIIPEIYPLNITLITYNSNNGDYALSDFLTLDGENDSYSYTGGFVSMVGTQMIISYESTTTPSKIDGKSYVDNQVSNLQTELLEKANSADLATVATSGSYNDLSNKPTIPTAISELTNDSNFTTKSYVDGEISTINTVLSGKQNTLTFDSTPTANSTNPVTSGGIKTAIDNIDSGVYIGSTAPTGNQNVWIDTSGNPDSVVEDVRIDGTSIVSNGVANIPIASSSNKGIVGIDPDNGIKLTNINNLVIDRASSAQIKNGTDLYKPLTPINQHEATFYGLAKVAGSDMASSNNAVGTYTDEAKAAIKSMLGVPNITYDLNTGIAITSTANLNTYTNSGTYYADSSIIASITNAPTTTEEYKLVVESTGNNLIKQVVIASNDKIYTRSGSYNSSTWTFTDWVKCITSVDYASDGVIGAIKTNQNYGLTINNDGTIRTIISPDSYYKAGTSDYRPITISKAHTSTFYGLAKAAGDTTQSQSNNSVGIYTDNAKAAINTMIGSVSKDSLNNAGIIGRTYTTLFGGEFSVTTADNNDYISPYARASVTGRISKSNLHRVTFNGTEYILQTRLWYEINENSSLVALKVYEYLGNLDLYIDDTSGVVEGSDNVPFIIISDINDSSSIDVLTESEGTYTILVEQINETETLLPKSLVYGNYYSPFEKSNDNTSTYNGLSIGVNDLQSSRGTFSIGYGNKITDEFCLAMGSANQLTNAKAKAIGDGCIADGLSMLAVGCMNLPSISPTEWQNNTQYKKGDFVTGNYRGVLTMCGFCIKDHTSPSSGYFDSTVNGETVWDLNLWSSVDSLFVVGNGFLKHRSNAFKVDWGGNGRFHGSVFVDCNENSTGGARLISENDYATLDNCGIVRPHTYYGTTIINTSSSGILGISPAEQSDIKTGTTPYKPIVPGTQHFSTFYGLAKAAGDTTQASSNNAIGTYTDNAKTAIKSMLGIVDGYSVVTVSGTSPTITAESNTMYVCGEVTSLSFTPCASGICDVRFTSGSTVTVLTIPNTVKFSGSFDPTSLETNKIYEINILDGIYGVVTSWEI